MKNLLVSGCIAALLLAAAPVSASPHDATPEILKGVQAGTKWIGGVSSRIVGSPEHAAVRARLEKELSELPNVRLWTHDFPVMMPQVKKATIELGANRERIYPLWPAGVRMNTTPAEGIKGKLIYVGNGEPDDLPVGELRDKIVVMNVKGGHNWKTVFALGARAVVLLGSEDDRHIDFSSHVLPVTINLPRFYVPAGPLAETLRTSSEEATLYCRSAWEDVQARNLYALVKPENYEGGEKAIVVMVPFDAMSVVPELAPGADAAVDAALALELIKYSSKNPPRHPVMFAFVDAYAINQLGVRQALLSYSTLKEVRDQLQKSDAKNRQEYDNHVKLAGLIKEKKKPLSGLQGYAQWLKTSMSVCDDDSRSKTIPIILVLTGVIGLIAVWLIRPSTVKRSENTTGPDLRHLKCVGVAVVSALTIFIAALPLCFTDAALQHADIASDDILDLVSRPDFKDLHRYVKEEVQKKVLVVDAVLYPLRLTKSRVDRKINKLKNKHEERGTVAPASVMDPLLKEQAKLGVEVKKLEAKRQHIQVTQKQLIEEEPITDEFRTDVEILWQRMLARINGQKEANDRRFEIDKQHNQRRLDLASELGIIAREMDEVRPISFVMGLDISDSGIAAGPAFYDAFLLLDEKSNAKDFTAWVKKVEKSGQALVPDRVRLGVNLAPMDSLSSQSSHITGYVGTLTGSLKSFGVKGMTWATLNGSRSKVDTPNDIIEKLDWNRLGPQVEATAAMALLLFSDPEFVVENAKLSARIYRAQGMVADQAPGEPVARIPMSGYVTTMVPANKSKKYVSFLNPVPGLRHLEFVRTGPDGQFVIDGISGGSGHGSMRNLMMMAYAIEEDGRVSRAINKSEGGKGVKLTMNRRREGAPEALRGVVFTCEGVTIPGFFDPRFLSELPDMTVLDAKRGPPKRINADLYRDIINIYVEPDTSWQVLLRAGSVGNRMIFANVMPSEEAEGKSIRQTLRGFKGSNIGAHPFYAAAQDFYNLDARRVSDYKKAGIVSKPIEELQKRTKAELALADEALAKNDGREFFRASTAALANEIRAYQTVRKTADDVIRGAIFLLLALIPFSYAMERLLFASGHVYKQIFGGFMIFAVMAAMLFAFHPAFKMSSLPVMIVMAFGIISMSILTISVIFSKFENELERMRSSMAESISAKTSRLGLLSTAMRLGIANMRKRKLRTILTGMTIVLITFSLLCFMSASTYEGKKEYSINKPFDNHAVLIRQPADRPMPDQALRTLGTTTGKDLAIAPRYWWSVYSDTEWRLNVRNPVTGKQIQLMSGLGLSAAESEVSAVKTVCSDWDKFAENGGCYLAEDTARELDVKPGDMVVVGDSAIELIATFSSTDFDEKMMRLDGRSMLPPDYSSMDSDERSKTARSDTESAFIQMASGALGEEDSSVRALESSKIIVLPADMVREKKDCTLRNLAIPMGSAEEARNFAMKLSNRLSFPIYYTGVKEVRVVAARPLAPKAPKSVLIPLLIAGFIIFNTMLSSLAEREREIYIYTSLGLAPVHVGVLFLAEAITYGLLGSIFGYVAGQGLAKVFSALGWMGGITLNFGGTQAIITMSLVLVIVVASSLVPAYLAGKVATPSNKMTWIVPAPEVIPNGYMIKDALPFTATARTAAGIGAFLYEFFDAHKDGNIGNFTADSIGLKEAVEDGCRTIVVTSTVWLSPYDFGVRQNLRLTISDLLEEEDVYEIRVELTHGSGQLTSWRRLNKMFLGDLRRQLLGWRKLEAKSLVAFIEQGDELLAKV